LILSALGCEQFVWFTFLDFVLPTVRSVCGCHLLFRSSARLSFCLHQGLGFFSLVSSCFPVPEVHLGLLFAVFLSFYFLFFTSAALSMFCIAVSCSDSVVSLAICRAIAK